MHGAPSVPSGTAIVTSPRSGVLFTKVRTHGSVLAKFHYTDPTGPARTFLRPGSPRNSVGSVRVSDKVRAGPRGSGRARVVEFSLSHAKIYVREAIHKTFLRTKNRKCVRKYTNGLSCRTTEIFANRQWIARTQNRKTCVRKNFSRT